MAAAVAVFTLLVRTLDCSGPVRLLSSKHFCLTMRCMIAGGFGTYSPTPSRTISFTFNQHTGFNIFYDNIFPSFQLCARALAPISNGFFIASFSSSPHRTEYDSFFVMLVPVNDNGLALLPLDNNWMKKKIHEKKILLKLNRNDTISENLIMEQLIWHECSCME